MTTLDSVQIHAVSKKAWELAKFAGENNGLRVTKNRKTGFLITVDGGASKFIRMAGEELGVKAIKNNKSDLEAVRVYLKDAYNIVSIGRVEEANKYTWRLFVADEWSDSQTPVVVHHKVSKNMAHEIEKAATSGQSGEVVTKSVFDEFSENPLGELQCVVMRALARHPKGEYKPPKGKNSFVTNDVLADDEKRPPSAPASSVLGSLADRGLIEYESYGRRMKMMRLTDRGCIVASKIHLAQTAEVAVAYVVRMAGSIKETDLTQHLADLTHKTSNSCATALGMLEEEGLVVTARSTNKVGKGQSYSEVAWVGDGDMPGIFLDDTEWPDTKKTPEKDAQDRPTRARSSTPTTDTPDEPAPDTAQQDAIPATPAPAPTSAPVVTPEFAERFAADVLTALKERDSVYQRTLITVRNAIKQFEEGNQSALTTIDAIQRLVEERLS